MKICKATNKDLNDLNIIREKKLIKLHNSRFELQKKDKAFYFIAYIKNKPVGHVFVVLEGNEKYHTCPTLQDLFVKENLRRKKIGSKILKKVETKLKKICYKKVGLDVETREKWLLSFYNKMDYKIIGKPHRQNWIQKDSGKKMNTIVYHLEKRLK